MWQWLTQYSSHALAPVLKHRPVHSAKECAYCAQQQRHQVHHIQAHVPLSHQPESLDRTTLSRFALVVNRVVTPESAAHGRMVGEVCLRGLQCRLSRVLDVHQPETVAPTDTHVQSELATLCAASKGGDRLVVYWHDGPQHPWGAADDLLHTLSSLYSTSTPRYCFVWCVATQPVGTHPLLPYRYTLDPAHQDRVACVSPTAAITAAHGSSSSPKLRLHVLVPQFSADPSATALFTARWLDVMQRHRCRVSVFQLLQALSGTAAFLSNGPVSLRTTYFGF